MIIECEHKKKKKKELSLAPDNHLCHDLWSKFKENNENVDRRALCSHTGGNNHEIGLGL